MKRPKFFILFFAMCASFTCAQSDALNKTIKSDSTTAEITNMGWDTTATTQIFVADETIKPAARRFTLQGFAMQEHFRDRCGIFLENNRKIIIIK